MKIRSFAVAATSLALLSLGTPAALAQDSGSIAGGSLGTPGAIATEGGGSLGSLTGSLGGAPVLETPEQKADREAKAALEQWISDDFPPAMSVRTNEFDDLAQRCVREAIAGDVELIPDTDLIENGAIPNISLGVSCIVVKFPKSALSEIMKMGTGIDSEGPGFTVHYGVAAGADKSSYYLAITAENAAFDI